jgi:DNA-dependent protein kinase catalytic subunit
VAACSITGYLLGIGDRHLENFLIDISDGEVLCIDFGVAFGSGLQLGIPELMPFRLTQQIEGVIAPHPLEGVYKQTMMHAMTALKKRKSLVLDTCEIFVKEPLLEWAKEAKQQNQGGDDEDEISWYPKEKIDIMKDKLNGMNPATVLLKELKESRHAKRNYCKSLVKVIKGNEQSQRHQLLAQGNRYLDVDA